MSNPTIPEALTRILAEITEATTLAVQRTTPLQAAIELAETSPRIFVHGAGRSGLALQMMAMRLMHLGLEVHVVGEVTAPAIGEGDLLISASGSGSTPSVVRAAETAKTVAAHVLAITTDPDAPLAHLAEATLVIPAAAKADRSQVSSSQYAGSLFEQSVLVLGDALFDVLWHRSGSSADELWPRHANLE